MAVEVVVVLGERVSVGKKKDYRLMSCGRDHRYH